MDSYAKAKFKLFERGRTKRGLVCEGKDYVDQLFNTDHTPILSYGFEGNVDFTGSVIEKTFNGSKFYCKSPYGSMGIMTPLVGQYNLENALAAIATCKCLGIDDWDIKKGLSCTLPVEGRFNVIKGDNCNIIVDYAHTPDGLEKVLSTARELTKGKLVVVFGCGGNRDKQKRPIMGKIASELADEVILTNDNPRHEIPCEIIADIKSGMTKRNFFIEENRTKAINYALRKFNNGETIIIAGKGAEKYQEARGVKHPYNDFDVICQFYKKEALKQEINSEEIENE